MIWKLRLSNTIDDLIKVRTEDRWKYEYGFMIRDFRRQINSQNLRLGIQLNHRLILCTNRSGERNEVITTLYHIHLSVFCFISRPSDKTEPYPLVTPAGRETLYFYNFHFFLISRIKIWSTTFLIYVHHSSLWRRITFSQSICAPQWKQ